MWTGEWTPPATDHADGDDEALALLALEDGAIFTGQPFGAVERMAGGRRGEVVFATSMSGYQEICTDPSYRGQMVVLTYPLIGNYGVTPDDGESRRPWLAALLVRERCDEYSNWRATESLQQYLARHGIPGVHGLDTRALTRHLRANGTLRGVLRAYPAGVIPSQRAIAQLIAEARAVRSVSELPVVAEVSPATTALWRGGSDPVRSPAPAPQGSGLPPAAAPCPPKEGGQGVSSAFPFPPREGGQGVRSPRVVVIDTGCKQSIARCLAARGLEVVLAPHSVTRQQLARLRPDGVLLSNGPGDPENVAHLVELTRALLEQRMPLMGICLGHQALGLAIGATTSRLPFGHHGSNHPVKDLRTGRVTITAQNHSFQVDAASIPAASGFYVSHINLSDGSVEGLAHDTLPVCSLQYHPEAAPGPQDNHDLFDQFANLVARERVALLAG